MNSLDKMEDYDRLQADLESLKRERAMLVDALTFIMNLDYTNSATNGCAYDANIVAVRALSATSEQSLQWLNEQKAEEMERAAAWFESSPIIDAFGVRDVLQKMASELRLAASKRKEQV